MPEKLDAENERQGDVRGLQTTVECAAAGDHGRETASFGGGRVESFAEPKIPEPDGVHSTSKLVMVGRAFGVSLSPPVVALKLGRVRA